MEKIELKLNDKGQGSILIMNGEEQLGEMEVRIEGNKLTAFHTEVSPMAEGKGYGKKLLQAMSDHARKNDLKVYPVCAYVIAQFKRNPEMYSDITFKEESQAD